MRPYFKASLFFIILFSVSLTARMFIAPGVHPIAENGQSNFSLQVAFVLKSLEYIGLFGLIFVVLLAAFGWLRRSRS